MPKPPAVPEISPDELLVAAESGQPIQVLDIRAPARVQGGRIDAVPDSQFANIVGSRLAAMTSPDDTGLDPTLPVAVVCGHGNSSKPATLFLAQLGFSAQSVRGGMAAWMLMAVPRALEAPPGVDRFIQFDRVGKGALGYLLVSDGEALIIDPPRSVEAYQRAVDDAGARVVGVADTHVHADYISGAPGLARALGVPYYLHAADAVYPYDGTPGRLEFEPLADGTELVIGRATVRVVHTPGHTEGSVSFLVGDAAALTGDFLFIESIGRPDLAGKASEWAEQLWTSVTEAKTSWPRQMMIHPAHYASDRERNGDRSVGKPLGDLLDGNEVLATESREAFINWVLRRSTTAPAAYPKIKAVNVGLRPVTPLEAEELEVGKNECAVSGP